jgi:Xylose isomerase-like TIM barrel
MTIQPILTYNETSIPGSSSERLQLAVRENLALEVANEGNFPLELYQPYRISAVQAFAMHDFHPIHRDRNIQQEAVRHVRDTIEVAAQLNVPRIVTVCGFGYELADHPFERCLDFFSSFAEQAKAAGIRIMIEHLSPLRVGAMTDPEEIARLVEMLNDPSVFSIMLDTGHLVDTGIELDSFFANWNRPIEELQLKGPRSAPPSPEMPVKRWLEALPALPAVVCVEHRQPTTEAALVELVGALRDTGMFG